MQPSANIIGSSVQNRKKFPHAITKRRPASRATAFGRAIGDLPKKDTALSRHHLAADKISNQKGEMRYSADITAGALKVSESRRIAELLLRGIDVDGWNDAIVNRNVLQARSPATARRIAKLIRARLELMGPDLWMLVRDGKGSVATHATFAAAVKHSPLLGDFLGIVVAEQYRRFGKAISNTMFGDYLEGCRERDPQMPMWTEATRLRIRSSVFQMLAQAGYLENTRTLKLQPVHIADQVIQYLEANREEYVLRCLQVSP
jgi:hypothetical protein